MGQSFGTVVRPDFIDTTINYSRNIHENRPAMTHSEHFSTRSNRCVRGTDASGAPKEQDGRDDASDSDSDDDTPAFIRLLVSYRPWSPKMLLIAPE